MRGSTVLVTGAQGFVGSWLAQRLLDDGARVVVPLRDVEPESRFRSEGLEERCTVVPCDVTDYESLLRVLNEHEVTTVFHLAAQTLVGTANRGPLSTWESNVRGTWTLLEACRTHGVVAGAVERIVVASSDKAYGDQEDLPYREELPLRARFPVRRVEGLHGHDRALVRHDLRHAGRGHAAGERLRAGRRQLVAHRAGHRARARARGATGDPLRRHARARLPLRRGRRRRLPRGRGLARRPDAARPSLERRLGPAAVGARAGARA